jgi:hypothetical protein
MDIAAQIEHTLRTHRPPGLDETLPEQFILPHYGGYSIANIPPTIAALLGTELPAAAPPLPDHLWTDMAAGVRRVVLVILDAVGYLSLQRILAEEDSVLRRLARAGRLVPLTSVFPSTTVAAMTTLWTGQTPLGHGFLGTKLLLAEQGLLANMLRLAPAAHRQPEELLEWGWDPEEFVTVPSLGQRLAASGIQTIAHTYYAFIGSGLTDIFMRGIENKQGYVSFSDMWINLRRTLLQPPESPSGQDSLFVSVYWGTLDTVAHSYGPEGEPFQAALRHLARSLEEELLAPLPTSAREGTLLIISADHGQIATPPERAVHLADHPALRQMLLLPPAGEPRAAYLYTRPGQSEPLRAYVAEHLADRFLTLDTEQALAAGLFGPETPTLDLRARLGDLLLLAQNDSQIIAKEEKFILRGYHGSLTPEEMLVPLLLVRLDRL